MSAAERFSHCHFCGARYAADQPWPRQCAVCGGTTYQNPLPVAVVLVPVDGGLLLVRRAIEPRRGQLALPGGFIGVGESWQVAGAREVLEETGVSIDPATITLFDALSAPDGTLLVFGRSAPLSAVPTLLPNAEVSELVVLRGPETLAFPLHTQVAARYFAGVIAR